MDPKPRFKTRQEIAAELGISARTLKKIAEINGIELPKWTLVKPATYEKLKEVFYQK
jgi:predicted transcriptional regulator